MRFLQLLSLCVIISACTSGKENVKYAKNKPTIIPTEGVITGNFYKEEMTFIGRTAGHTGVLWAIHDGTKILDVYFDEQARPSYHTKKYARVFKRLNDYNEMMAKDNRGIGWFNGVRNLELEWIKKGELDPEIDITTGASNTPENGMLPLSKKIQERINAGEKKQTATRVVKKHEDGTYGDLLVVYEGNKIVDFSYDELIPEDYSDPIYSNIAGESKKYSLEYKISPPARFGFFYTENLMKEQIIKENNLHAVATVFEEEYHDQTILPRYLSMLEEIK